MTEVKGIGSYLSRRISTSFLPRGATQVQLASFTVGQLWERAERMTTGAVKKSLLRALQNERGNECVSRRRGGREEEYHVGDVNQRGYEACVALLDWRRGMAGRRRTTYGAILPIRLPPRARSSKECGCIQDRRDCTGHCAWTGDGSCVPHPHNATGFVGTPHHPDQREVARTDAERRSVRRRAHTRLSASLRADAHSSSDLTAGKRRTVSYSRRGNTMWRKPSSKVRLPAKV